MRDKTDVLSRISSTFISNLVSLAVSAIIVLIVPRFISVEHYGYFQMYLFYVGYIGFANFGWPEGIMLKYGGQSYDALDKSSLKVQFILFFLMTAVIAIGMCLLACIRGNEERGYIWFGVACATLFTLPCHFLQVLLHMSNRTHDYAQGILIEKILYFVTVIAALLVNANSFVWLIGADLLGRFASFFYSIYKNKAIFFAEASPVLQELPKVKENISSGIKLMLSNLMGLFLIGIIRQCIEIHWSVEVFAKVSLTLSISNMLMVFIRAVAIVLFPMLKATAYEKLQSIYGMLRTGTMTVLLTMLIFYYPISRSLLIWLPHYSESVRYVALLFPMCVFECRMSMLVETYLKALRMERQILRINIFCLVLSAALAGTTVFVLNSLEFSLLSIVLVVGIRCILAEIVLTHRMNQHKHKEILQETVMVVGFIVFNWVIGGMQGFILYLLFYACYLWLNAKEIDHVVGLAKRKQT